MDAQYSHVVPKTNDRNRTVAASSTGTILTSSSLNVVRCPIDDVVLIDLLLSGHVKMLGWTFDRTFAAKSKVDGLNFFQSFKSSKKMFTVKLGTKPVF